MPSNLPAAGRRFDNAELVAQGLAFDYGGLPARVMESAWVPSYCRS
jgi:hypothetical protein